MQLNHALVGHRQRTAPECLAVGSLQWHGPATVIGGGTH